MAALLVWDRRAGGGLLNLRLWIPAFAGMTAVMYLSAAAAIHDIMAKGRLLQGKSWEIHYVESKVFTFLIRP